jgi:hypothetical protein
MGTGHLTTHEKNSGGIAEREKSYPALVIEFRVVILDLGIGGY